MRGDTTDNRPIKRVAVANESAKSCGTAHPSRPSAVTVIPFGAAVNFNSTPFSPFEHSELNEK